jgi:small subunit ribosomal protein S1
MADVLNPEQIESNPLNTELETPTLEAATDHADSSIETTHNPEVPSAEPTEAVAVAPAEPVVESVESIDDLDFGSMEDFAAALESFDREQAAEAAAQAFDDSSVVSGTVIKLTDKHVVVDVGMKS